MKMAKGFVLGSAAGWAALTAAHAADLPVKAKAVEYVKICSLYGAGFYYIPGTDTCIRIGGAMRLDTAFNAASNYDVPFYQGGAGGANVYGRSCIATKTRLNLFVDTRTATEYGVVRTYANIHFDWAQRTREYRGRFHRKRLPVHSVRRIYLRQGSRRSSTRSGRWPNRISGRVCSPGPNTATGITQLAYTAQFGNGVSGTLSLEDAQPYRTAGVINTSTGILGPFGGATSGYGTTANTFAGNMSGGDHVPDIVANLRLDQAWGSLHAGAAAHEVHGSYHTTADSSTGHPNSTWGYALTGAFELKNLPTGVGDSLRVEATFSAARPIHLGRHRRYGRCRPVRQDRQWKRDRRQHGLWLCA